MTKTQRAALVTTLLALALLVGVLGLGYGLGLTDISERWMEAFAALGIFATTLAILGVCFVVVILLVEWVWRGKE